MQDPPTRTRDALDMRLYLPLLVQAVGVQMVLSLNRIVTTYRAIELDLPVLTIGIITATYSILPMVLAMMVGRMLDRGHDIRVMRIGSIAGVAASTGFAFWSGGAATLVFWSAAMGFAHLLLLSSQQILCARCGGAHHREAAFGNYMVANAIGQGLGPLVLAAVSRGAHAPDTRLLFQICLGAMIASAVVGWVMPQAKAAKAGKGAPPPVPLRDLFRIQGLPAVFLASMVIVTSGDLVAVYLPLLGAERLIAASDIGFLLTVRAVASMVCRLFYAAMVRALGHRRLSVVTITIGAAAFGLMAAPAPLPVLYGAAALMGLGLGVAATLTVTTVVHLVPPGARGTAISLRITGNRLGQVILPFAAGLAASATGAAGVLVAIGIALAASAAAMQASRSG